MALENVSLALNSTLLNATGTVAGPGFFASTFTFLLAVLASLWDLVAAPFRHGEMLWIVLPLIFSLVVMEFYFERHWDEELGWAAAVANSLILIFVAIDLIKTAFGAVTPWHFLRMVLLAALGEGSIPISPQVLILILFVGFLGVSFTLVNYLHLLPKKIAFSVSGHPPINYLAYFAIAIVYSQETGRPIPFDLATFVAGGLLFILLLVLVFIVKKAFPTLFSLKQYKRPQK